MAARKRQDQRFVSPTVPTVARAHRITTVRPDGSRWTYTPPAYYTPRDKRSPQTPEAMLVALEAIKPHRDPKPHRPESIEAYAKRMARLHALPDVGATVDDTPRCHRHYGDAMATYVRLPDDADEGAPREASDQIAADTALAEYAAAVAAPSDAFDIICALVAAEACPRCLGQTPGIPAGDPEHPYTGALAAEVCEACDQAIAYERTERAVAATVRADTRREYFGAGAWSRRQRMPVIADWDHTATLSEVA